jgi:hypothetical protein
MEVEWLVIVVMATALAVLLVSWVRAVRRSRALVRHYRAVGGAERHRLDRRMEWDSELEAHMRPLARWEIFVGAAIALGMVYVVAT